MALSASTPPHAPARGGLNSSLLKFAQHNGSTSGQPSHGKSLDDQDLLRFRSSSSFGWYDEDTMSDDLGNSGSAVGFQQIDDWREGTEEGWDGGPPGEGSKKEKYFEERSQHMTTTKTFRLAQRGGVPYTVAIRAIRVVGSGVGHAQYEVLLTSGDQSWSCWKRFSDFKLLAEYAKISDLKNSVYAWVELQQTQRWFRCLDVKYLRGKCMLLERFMAQLLFELPSPGLLLTFVQAPQDLGKRPSDTVRESNPPV